MVTICLFKPVNIFTWSVKRGGLLKVAFNLFKPEFQKQTLPPSNLNIWIVAKRMILVNQKRLTNNIDPDETAHYESSHQDLYHLQKYLF